MRLQKTNNEVDCTSSIRLQPIMIQLSDEKLEMAHQKLKSKYNRLKILSIVNSILLIAAGSYIVTSGI